MVTNISMEPKTAVEDINWTEGINWEPQTAAEVLEKNIFQAETVFRMMDQRGAYKTQKERRGEINKILGMQHALKIIKRHEETKGGANL